MSKCITCEYFQQTHDPDYGKCEKHAVRIGTQGYGVKETDCAVVHVDGSPMARAEVGKDFGCIHYSEKRTEDNIKNKMWTLDEVVSKMHELTDAANKRLDELTEEMRRR